MVHDYIANWFFNPAIFRSELRVIASNDLRRIKASGTPLRNAFSYLFIYVFQPKLMVARQGHVITLLQTIGTSGKPARRPAIRQVGQRGRPLN